MGHLTIKFNSIKFNSLGLLSNVPTGQILNVIKSVLKLAGKETDNLPSKSTINEWNLMRLSISQQQLAEQLPQASHLGLLNYKTSKFGKKYEGFYVAGETGKLYVL